MKIFQRASFLSKLPQCAVLRLCYFSTKISDYFLVERNPLNNNSLLNKEQIKKVESYKNSIGTHFKLDYPFTNLEVYLNILRGIESIEEFAESRDGLIILNELLMKQTEYLMSNHMDFMLQALYKISEKQCGSFKTYYLIEEEFLRKIPQHSTSEIAELGYCFAIANQGSTLLYKRISEEILKRKISNCSTREFVLLYSTLKLINLDSKMFWLIMEKANSELFKVDLSELI